MKSTRNLIYICCPGVKSSFRPSRLSRMPVSSRLQAIPIAITSGLTDKQAIRCDYSEGLCLIHSSRVGTARALRMIA
jgi:hypothetical protein